MKTAGSLLAMAGVLVGTGSVARAAPPITTMPLDDAPLVGERNGLFYLRDARDNVRLYPHAHLDLDARKTWGDSASRVSSDVAKADLGTSFVVRRARFGLEAEVFERINVAGSLDLASRPAVDGARSDGRQTRVALGDAWLDVIGGRALGLRLGLFQAPVSLENRTATSDLSLMERNVATRGFIVPGGQTLGVVVHGATRHERAGWDVGFAAADRLGPDDLGGGWSLLGRFSFRPVPALELGTSGRFGVHDDRRSDIAPSITTGQGFALLDASAFRQRGTSWVAGGDASWFVHRGVLLRGETFWVSRGLTQISDASPRIVGLDRAGRLEGLGGHLDLSIWFAQLLGAIDGEAIRGGDEPHVSHLELGQLANGADRYGFELAGVLAAIHAQYKEPDTSRDVDVMQVGVALNYWHTTRFRLSLNANYYLAPDSGEAGGLLRTPGNLVGVVDTHVMWEMGARTTLRF